MTDFKYPLNTILDIPEEEYFAIKAFSFSGIKEILTSPMHYYWKYVLGNEKETAAKRFGKLNHKAILEPDLFSKRVIQIPKFEAPTQKGNMSEQSGPARKARQDWFDGLLADRIPMTTEEFTETTELVNAILSQPKIAERLRKSVKREATIFWIDEATGMLCKARLDLICDDDWVCDFKTTTDARKWEFARSILKFKMHCQAAWYLRAYSKVIGKQATLFADIAIESTGPYNGKIYAQDAGTLDKGDELCTRALGIYAKCMKENVWPRYEDKVETIAIPMHGFDE